MASFARQLGYDSYIKVVIGSEGGHAYAEIKDGNTYIPLDWFSNTFGGPPYPGQIVDVLRDI
jgi:hypothetical protein